MERNLLNSDSYEERMTSICPHTTNNNNKKKNIAEIKFKIAKGMILLA
jgi:hypothetical protein